jgi:two-component system, chemotaxis family, protein-glutamate methylesterase/glutaminase
MRDLVVVGASAGGVEALCGLVSGLPRDLPASVLVVLHLPADSASVLPAILGRSGTLPAHSATHGQRLEPGHIYVAPPNHHLLLMDGMLGLSRRPAENGRRPAIDALFRSAAIVGGPRVIGLLLSGVLDDGVAGLVSIAGRKGLVIVQDPKEARYSGMPRHALETVHVDHVLPVAEMGAVLAMRTREQVEFAGVGCSDCTGTETSLDIRGAALERALWTAIHTLEERACLSRRMAGRAKERGSTRLATHHQSVADEAAEAAAVLRAPFGVSGRTYSEQSA